MFSDDQTINKQIPKNYKIIDEEIVIVIHPFNSFIYFLISFNHFFRLRIRYTVANSISFIRPKKNRPMSGVLKAGSSGIIKEKIVKLGWELLPHPP